MSLNREHVLWESKNGQWNLGFYKYEVVGPDYEWDVEYDTREFWWVSTGHATEQEAWNVGQATHSNPGHRNIAPYDKDHPEESITWDRMATWVDHPELKVAYEKRVRAAQDRARVKTLSALPALKKRRTEMIVTFIHTPSVPVNYSATQTVTGLLTEKNGWVMIGSHKVMSLKTGKVRNSVLSITEVEPTHRSRNRYNRVAGW